MNTVILFVALSALVGGTRPYSFMIEGFQSESACEREAQKIRSKLGTKYDFHMCQTINKV